MAQIFDCAGSIPAAVMFDDGRAIPLEAVAAYTDKNYVWPDRVYWEDGSWSYAKGWREGFDAGHTRVTLIGAGAYGNSIIYRE